MYGVSVLLLWLTTELVLAQEMDIWKQMTIGVIANGSRPEAQTQLSDYEYNVTMLWKFLDTSEAFKVFTAVQRFDKLQSVDVILLFDYDPTVMPDSLMLRTQHKQLIKLGKRKSRSGDTNTASQRVSKRSIHHQVNLENAPYCKTRLNASFMSLGNMERSFLKQPITHLLHSLKWTSIVIVHDNATAAELQELTDVLSRGGVLFVLYNIDEIDDLHAVLTRIYMSTVKLLREINFMVLGRPRSVANILSIANQFDEEHTLQKTLLKQFSRWLVVVYGHTTEVAGQVRASAANLDNVVVIAVPEGDHPATTDLHAIWQAVATAAYREEIANISTGNTTNEQLVNKLIKTIFAWNPISQCQGYYVDTLMWTSATSRGFSSVGYIDTAGNTVLHSRLFPNIDYGYNNRTFIVSTLEWNPFVLRIKKNITDNVTGEVTGEVTVGYEGFTMDLLHELSHALNFTYQLIEPADQNWGGIVIKHNMTFNGLIGQLQRLECDLAAAPLAVNPDRDMVADFSYPYFLEYTGVIVKKPDSSATKWRTLIDPFKWEVLLTIGGALLLATVMICLLERYNPYYDTPEHGEERNINGGLHHLHNSFWYMYGCLLNQGGVHLPDSIAGRTFVSCWWLTCIVIVGIYSGNLIAFLTFRKEKPPFTTLAEMVELPDLTWATVGSTVWSAAFLSSSLPTYRKIGDGLRKFNKTDPGVLHSSLDYHINRVKKGGYAWIGDITSIEYVTSTQCGLIKVKEEFLPMDYAIAFPDGSPHTFLFSEQIMKLHESGLLQIWKRKWWPKSSFCAGDPVPEATPIMLVDVQSAFYVCVLATFIGTLAFITEHIVFRVRKYRNRNTRSPPVRSVSAIETLDTSL